MRKYSIFDLAFELILIWLCVFVSGWDLTLDVCVCKNDSITGNALRKQYFLHLVGNDFLTIVIDVYRSHNISFLAQYIEKMPFQRD